MSTYLVALIAGPYASGATSTATSTARSRSALLPQVAGRIHGRRTAVHRDQAGFGFYHNNFGVPYAFGKYDQLFVPEFNAGAMENAGAVTFLEDYVFRSKVTRYSYERRAETVLHEMAHMWFGDLVTMTWWDDLWLNESFATFASVLCQAEATEYTRRGRRSPTSRSPGPTARTSCRRRTRSPPTSPTCTPSRSTSTASPTPRAPACSSSWSPTSG
jgi:aminopeptidase N